MADWKWELSRSETCFISHLNGGIYTLVSNFLTDIMLSDDMKPNAGDKNSNNLATQSIGKATVGSWIPMKIWINERRQARTRIQIDKLII